MNPISQRIHAITELAMERKNQQPSEAVITACEIVIRLTDNIKFGWTPANEF